MNMKRIGIAITWMGVCAIMTNILLFEWLRRREWGKGVMGALLTTYYSVLGWPGAHILVKDPNLWAERVMGV